MRDDVAARLRLERPSAARAPSFAAMRDACLAEDDNGWAGPHQLAHSDPVAYAAMLRDWAVGQNVPDGWVPTDAFWIVLTPRLRNVGGHIGYGVHPAHRNRGIATFALRECLKVLAARGETEALLTCAASNAASARVMERCGGRRVEDSTLGRRRYVIPLSPP